MQWKSRSAAPRPSPAVAHLRAVAGRLSSHIALAHALLLSRPRAKVCCLGRAYSHARVRFSELSLHCTMPRRSVASARGSNGGLTLLCGGAG
jgi:hypothetical protein